MESITARAGNLQEAAKKPKKKEKENKVEMPKGEYKAEHKHLIKILRKCKTAAAKQEAKKQSKEMKKELKVKESAIRVNLAKPTAVVPRSTKFYHNSPIALISPATDFGRKLEQTSVDSPGFSDHGMLIHGKGKAGISGDSSYSRGGSNRHKVTAETRAENARFRTEQLNQFKKLKLNQFKKLKKKD